MYVTMIIAYSIISRTEGLGMKSWEMVLCYLNLVEPIKLQRFVTYTFQRNGSSANCISSIPIAKPHPGISKSALDLDGFMALASERLQ